MMDKKKEQTRKPLMIDPRISSCRKGEGVGSWDFPCLPDDPPRLHLPKEIARPLLVEKKEDHKKEESSEQYKREVK